MILEFPPPTWFTPAGKFQAYPVAVVTFPAVRVKAVVVPTNALMFVMAVVVTPLVKDKSTGAVGNALVKADVRAALEQPSAFTDLE